MKKPIPKSVENKIRDYVKHQQKAIELDNELRHWLYNNNYDRALVDMLIDVGQSGEAESLIEFMNGEPDINGYTVDNFYNDNSDIDEEDYM